MSFRKFFSSPLALNHLKRFQPSSCQYYHQEMSIVVSNSRLPLQSSGNFQLVLHNIPLEFYLKSIKILHDNAGADVSLIAAFTCPLRHSKYSECELKKNKCLFQTFSSI